ncbi:hypothetical protein HKD37_04G010331 [Glycine soja]
MGHWIEKLQVDWARDAREGPRVLMSLRSTKFRALLSLSLHSSHSSSKLLSMASYGVASPLSLPFSIPLPFIFQEAKESIDEEDPRPTSSNGACIMWYQEHLHLGTNMSLHSSSSVNGEGSTPKDPLYKILDELRSLKLWKEKQERKEKGKKRVEEISQDERKKIREEERRKIIKEMKREKHVSYSSHNSCKSLSEELRDYYEGRHRSHLRPHSHRRENERKPQEVNIKLPYFHGKDNVEANLDWEIRVEQQLKRKSTSKSYGSHSYPKKDQGQGILGVRPSKPKDDKGKTIEKQPLKASMQEKTSSMKCFKCLGRGHITSQCPTKKTMIMRGQDIYSSQDEATTSPSSSKSEEAKGEESSEEIYPQEEGQPLMVKEECKEVSVSSKRLAKKERHFEIKTNIKEISLLRQPPHFLLCKKTLVSIATSLRLEFIPQVKELLDEGLVRKRLNPCALLVPKIGVKGRSPEYQEPQDLRFQSSFRAQNFVLFSPSPFIHLILPPSSYPWPPMVTHLLLEVASPLSLPFSIPLPFIFQEAKESIDEEDPRPTSSNGACIIVNGEGSTPKDPLYKILDELRSLKLWKEKQERKEKGKKRVEEISQDERKKIREEERRKIIKEMKREKHVSYSSHNSCKSLSEELRDYYEGRHRSHLRPHSHRRENERKPQEVNIKLPYFHGKDNVEANLDWEIRVEQQLKRKSTSKSYGSHSYPKKDQGQGILGVRPSKPKDDKGKTIEKQPLKASMQEKTSSMKCFKCLGRGHITSQCPTKKTMIMRGQDIYSSQDEATTSPSSSKSEEAKGEESSEEIYPQEEGQPLMVKEECKEVSVSSKRLAKKERHFEIKTNIKEISLLRQPPHFLLCKKTLVSIATSLRLEFIPQVKELLDEGLVRKRLNPCALLVPKIGIIRHQIPKIGGVMNALGGATLFCKITHAPNIFMICVHRDSLGSFNTNLGTHMGHLRFVILFGRNNQHENTEKGVKGRSPEYQEPQDLRLIFSLKWRLLSLSLSPFRCHSSSKKQRNPLMKKILGLQAPMELASYSLPFGSTALSNFSLTSDNSSIYPLTPCIPSLICPSRPF